MSLAPYREKMPAGSSWNDSKRGDAIMCILCNRGRLDRFTSRRNFLKGAAASGAAASALNLFAPRPAAADDRPPDSTGRDGRRVLIRGGAVMSMDPQVGDFPVADVLIEGKKIRAV